MSGASQNMNKFSKDEKLVYSTDFRFNIVFTNKVDTIQLGNAYAYLGIIIFLLLF